MNNELFNIIKNAIPYGLTGGLASYIIFVIMLFAFRATDVQGYILVATITICTIICSCTKLLLETITKQ
jgi:hypothetical protein